MQATIIGTDLSDERLTLASDLGLVDAAIKADDNALGQILTRTGGRGCEVSIDCSGAAAARLLALQGTRDWGRCAYVGEGGTVSFEVSKELIHKQITLFGSWVTSLRASWKNWSSASIAGASTRTAPARTGWPLSEAGKAYELAAGGQTGKVCIVLED